MNNFHWEQIIDFFKQSGLSVFKALFILLIGIFAIKKIQNFLNKILKKSHIDRIAIGFLITFSKIVLYIFLTVLLMQVLGFSTTGIITLISTITISIGLALKDSLSSISSGIIIIANRNIKEGDYVSILGQEGTVSRINFFFTHLTSVDNKEIIIPNSSLINNALINYSKNDFRRLEVEFEVSHGVNVELCKKIILEALYECDGLQANKLPQIYVNQKKNHSITIFAFVWCKSVDFWKNYYFVREKVILEFEKLSINNAPLVVKVVDNQRQQKSD